MDGKKNITKWTRVERNIYLVNSHYHVRYMIRGKRVSECVGKKGNIGLPHVRQFLATREREVLEGRIRSVVDIRAKESLGGIFSDYLQYAIENNKSPERAKYAIKQLSEVFIRSGDFTEEKVEEYKRKRQKDNVSATTIDRELNVLSAAYNRAIEKKNLTSRTLNVKRFNECKEHQKDDFLSVEEVGRLLKSTPKFTYFHTFILCSFYLGYRKSEILGIKWGDINFTTEHINLNKTKTSRKKPLLHNDLRKYLIELQVHNGGTIKAATRELEGLQKGHKALVSEDRYRRNEKKQLTLTNKLKGARSEYIMSMAGEQIKDIKKSWKSHLRAVGITKSFTPHDLCHTFASHFLMNGGTLHELLEYGRWDDMRSLLRYAHIEKEQLRKKLNRMSLEKENKSDDDG